MKKLILILSIILLSSCGSLTVYSDNYVDRWDYYPYNDPYFNRAYVWTQPRYYYQPQVRINVVKPQVSKPRIVSKPQDRGRSNTQTNQNYNKNLRSNKSKPQQDEKKRTERDY
jgi:hypothetical protein